MCTDMCLNQKILADLLARLIGENEAGGTRARYSGFILRNTDA
jgi:hypothetical protein